MTSLNKTTLQSIIQVLNDTQPFFGEATPATKSAFQKLAELDANGLVEIVKNSHSVEVRDTDWQRKAVTRLSNYVVVLRKITPYLVACSQASLVAQLIDLFEANEAAIRENAVFALCCCGSKVVIPLCEALTSPVERRRYLAAHTLRRLKPVGSRATDVSPAILPLLERLEDVSETEPVRRVALDFLREYAGQDNRLLEISGRILEEEEKAGKPVPPSLRHRAALALGAAGDLRSLNGLVEALEDSDSQLSIKATEYLARLDGPLATSALLNLLDTTTEVKVQPEVLLSRFGELAKLGNSTGTARLITFLLDTSYSPTSRIGAAQLLGELGERRAVAALQKTSLDQDPFLAGHSIAALGRIGDEQVFPFLLKLTGKIFTLWHWRSPEVAGLIRSEAAASLGRLGNPAALRRLRWMARYDKTRWGRGNIVAHSARGAITLIELELEKRKAGR